MISTICFSSSFPPFSLSMYTNTFFSPPRPSTSHPCPLYLYAISISPSLSILSICPHRLGGERSQHRDHSAAGGGAVRAGGLLVSVCGLELRRDHQEPQSPRPHRLWVFSSRSPSHYSVFIFPLIFVFLSKQNLLAAKWMRLTATCASWEIYIFWRWRQWNKWFTNMGLKCPFELESVKRLQNRARFFCLQYKPGETKESCRSVYTFKRLWHMFMPALPLFFL